MRRLAAAVILVVLLTGCRASGARPLAEVVPPGTAAFALDPLPTPARARLEDRVLPAWPGAVLVVYEDLPGAVPGAYVLDVREHEGRTVVRIAASGAPGRRHAAATLRQLVAHAGGREFLRAGRVEDAPALPLRGSKRPLGWETLYKANFGYERQSGRPEFVAVSSPGGTLDATEGGIAAAMERIAAGHATGVRRFAIEFDDVGFGLTPETRDRFGAYAPAIVHYLREIRKGLAALDPEAVLYWLPQTYWTDDPRLPVFARDVGLAGGVPADIGLVLTGPEVISERIRAADLAAARRRFGLSRRPALIYDNLGREGDHGPLTGREASLMTQVDGVFGERGEILNRITRLDWNWNPLAYDPVRSHLLACREVAGAAAAPALSRLIREGERLPAEDRAHLAREVRAKFAPPPGRGALGDTRECVETILTAIGARP